MTTLRVAWLFARRGADDRSTVLLPVIAFAVSSLLLLVVAGGAQAFFSWRDGDAFIYQGLAVIALALLVVPLVGLGGSAARLSARRRDDREQGRGDRRGDQRDQAAGEGSGWGHTAIALVRISGLLIVPSPAGRG